MLYNILTDDKSEVWLLDAVTEGLSAKKSTRLLKTIMMRAQGRLVLISLPFAVGINTFDRILALKKGSILFDGPPSEWQLEKEA